MRVGLVDVDGHNFPNLALMKISHYHKRMGDDVLWYNMFEYFDKVYMSKVFTFTEDYGWVIGNAGEIVKGGTGYNKNMDLFCEDEPLDLDLYRGMPFYRENTSYGFLTRGCPNRCPWCIVPKKEGDLYISRDIESVAQGCGDVVLMDNNILASGDYAKVQMRKIIDMGLRVDFNQGLDARILAGDSEFMDLLSRMKWIDFIRLACDRKSQLEPVGICVDGLGKRGVKPYRIFVYCLIQDFEDSLERIYMLRKLGVTPFAQPYRDFDSDAEPPQWQKDMAHWVNKKSIFNSCDFKDFEPRKGFKCKEYYGQVLC